MNLPSLASSHLHILLGLIHANSGTSPLENTSVTALVLP